MGTLARMKIKGYLIYFKKEVLHLGIMLVEEDNLLPGLNVNLLFFPAYPKQRIVPSQDSLGK